SRPRYHPPLRARRRHNSDGGRETIYRREGGWTARHLRLSRRGWLFPAIRRRRKFLRLSKRRVDGYTDGLERRAQSADLAPRRRLQNAAAGETGHTREARGHGEIGGLRRPLSRGTILNENAWLPHPCARHQRLRGGPDVIKSRSCLPWNAPASSSGDSDCPAM